MSIPTIAVAQAQEDHARREQKRLLQQRQQRTAAGAGRSDCSGEQHQRARVKVYAAEVVALLQREEEEKQAAEFDALSPASKTNVTGVTLSPNTAATHPLHPITPRTPSPRLLMIPAAPPVVCVRLRSRPMKKFGHVRSASMVDLLFREVQQKAAGHREQLHDTVLRNQRINEQKIEQQWALIQRNNAGFVSEVRDYLALSTEQRQKLRESMYQRWCAQVFDPIQRQVAGHVGGQDRGLHDFRLRLFEHYLASPNTSLAFPTTCALPSHALTPPSPPNPPFRYTPPHTLPPLSSPRTLFTATMWDKLVATPYGRYNTSPSTLTPLDLRQIEEGVRGRVGRMGWDEYAVGREPWDAYQQWWDEYAVGREPWDAYQQWFGERGVKITGKGRRARGRGYNIVTNQ